MFMSESWHGTDAKERWTTGVVSPTEWAERLGSITILKKERCLLEFLKLTREVTTFPGKLVEVSKWMLSTLIN